MKLDELRKLEHLLKNNTIMGNFAPFTKYSSTYLETNENQKAIINILSPSNKDVLCVTSSGDFALNALGTGAKSVITFDKNIFAKYVLALKIATLKTYSDKELYIAFFNPQDSNFLKYNNFLEIKNNLDKDAYLFWSHAYTYINNHHLSLADTNFFRHTVYNFFHIQKQYNTYYESNTYMTLRKRLFITSPITYDLDINEILSLGNNYCFDYIYLSNIFQYYESIKGLNTFEDVHAFIMQIKDKLLKDNGIIGVNYCYFSNLLNFLEIYDDDIRDLSNCLLLKYPTIYDLITFKNNYPDLEDGLIVTRKLKRAI